MKILKNKGKVLLVSIVVFLVVVSLVVFKTDTFKELYMYESFENPFYSTEYEDQYSIIERVYTFDGKKQIWLKLKTNVTEGDMVIKVLNPDNEIIFEELVTTDKTSIFKYELPKISGDWTFIGELNDTSTGWIIGEFSRMEFEW